MDREDYWIYCEAQTLWARQKNLYFWGHSECQWATHHQSLDGQWEWFFWI